MLATWLVSGLSFWKLKPHVTKIKAMEQIKPGVKFIPDGLDEVWSVLFVPQDSFMHNGQLIENYLRNKFYAATPKGVVLCCFDCMFHPPLSHA